MMSRLLWHSLLRRATHSIVGLGEAHAYDHNPELLRPRGERGVADSVGANRQFSDPAEPVEDARGRQPGGVAILLAMDARRTRSS
jgi:hypothetical protein